MSRSLKKGPYIDPRVVAKVHKAKADNDRKPIKTWSRSCVITPDMVAVSFAVHNGRKFIEFTVDENMVGHKLGEFSPTRTFKAHSGKLAKEKK
jgi:small subunit ribosomal protein S19